jgi:hypothetical protein
MTVTVGRGVTTVRVTGFVDASLIPEFTHTYVPGNRFERGDGCMSRQFRNRVTATALGGFLFGVALLTTGTADAALVAGGGRQVEFAGGVLGLPCHSTPSAESMTVPADGTVRLVNRTGHLARLRLDGARTGLIPDDGSTEVAFHRGTTAVTLDPTCAITDRATPVLISASPSLTAGPGTMPAPGDPDTGPPGTPFAPGDGGTGGEPADSDSTLFDSPAPAIRSQRPSVPVPGRLTTIAPTTIAPTTIAAQPATIGQATIGPATIRPDRSHVAAQAEPQDGAARRTTTHRPGGTTRAVAPGVPPGDDETIPPGVPGPGRPASPTEAAPGHPAGSRSGVAVEPAAAERPLPDSQPLGLLAVIATVCVLGVTIAIIRAIVSERAYRANVA